MGYLFIKIVVSYSYFSPSTLVAEKFAIKNERMMNKLKLTAPT